MDERLDQPDYINTVFPTEQSLADIDDLIQNVKNDIGDLDSRTSTTLRIDTDAGCERQKALK